MPSIVIRERDLTSAGNLEATTNAVYIPGYSNMGPTNTPTLCETLADFQAIFGSEPYKIRAAQEWPSESNTFVSPALATTMGKFYEKGECEKSYIMAAELLKLGIPVLYERVANTEKEDGELSPAEMWTASATLYEGGTADTVSGNEIPSKSDTPLVTVSATSPGLVSKDIYVKIVNNPVILGKEIVVKGDPQTSKEVDKIHYYYTISVGRAANVDLGTGSIDAVTTQFTFSSEVAAQYTSCKLVYPAQSIIDNSGLVKLTFRDQAFSGKTVFYSQKVIKDTENKVIDVALEQFNLALPTSTTVTQDEFNVKDIYTMLANSKYDADTKEPKGLYKLLDKGEYVIKFITSGAYPTFEYAQNSIASNMAWVAAERGDCTALVDHTPNNERTLWAGASTSVYKEVVKWAVSLPANSLGEDSATYCAMFTPWGVYNSTVANKQVMLPASFGYLGALAVSAQINGSWAAAAGVARGGVPNLVSLCQNVTNAIADSYSNRDSISINPITNIKPYGLLIWGNRTLKNNAKKGDLTATSFLSIRQLTNDVKRTVWVAAKTLTFEQNNDILWINFKSKIIPTLDQMVSGGGISGYEIKKQKTTKKATVKAKVILYAIEPVEDWDITIELADQSTEITG